VTDEPASGTGSSASVGSGRFWSSFHVPPFLWVVVACWLSLLLARHWGGLGAGLTASPKGNWPFCTGTGYASYAVCGRSLSTPPRNLDHRSSKAPGVNELLRPRRITSVTATVVRPYAIRPCSRVELAPRVPLGPRFAEAGPPRCSVHFALRATASRRADESPRVRLVWAARNLNALLSGLPGVSAYRSPPPCGGGTSELLARAA